MKTASKGFLWKVISSFGFILFSFLFSGEAKASDLVYVKAVCENILHLHFDDGMVDVNGRNEHKKDDVIVYASPLNVSNATNKSNYTITSTDDAGWGSVKPSQVGRKSKAGEYFWPGETNEYVMEHEIYLELPSNLKSGKTYTVIVNGLADNLNEFTFKFDETILHSESVHVNMIGFPQNASKFAYLSHWMGDMGGLELNSWNGKPFHILKYSDKSVVYSGSISFRSEHNATNNLKGGAWGPYLNSTHADVCEMDFSALTAPGEYIVSVPGIGCSFPFEIENDIYNEVFYYAMKGLFTQRACIVQDLGNGKIYPRDHHPDDFTHYFNPNIVDFRHNAVKNAFNNNSYPLDKPVTGIWGWYHDASDWDMYQTHFRIPLQLMILYEAMPDRFYDGEIGNRYKLHESDANWIDEGNNGVPDILDEAAWLVNYGYRARHALMDQYPAHASGGLPGYIGREAGYNPGGILKPSWEDDREWAITGEHPDYTMGYAAIASMYAINLNTFYQQSNPGQDHPDYNKWMTEAEEAYNWVENNHGGNLLDNQDYGLKCIAAVNLYRHTGLAKYKNDAESAYNDDGGRTWHIESASIPYGYLAFIYISLIADEVDLTSNLESETTSRLVSRADYVVDKTNISEYRYGSYGEDKFELGMFGNPKVGAVMGQYFVSGQQKYLDAVDQNMAYVLGGHQLNKVFMSGIGERYINHAIHHIDAWCLNDYKSMIQSWDCLPGYSTYFGANNNWVGGVGDHNWTKESAYPSHENSPRAEMNFPNRNSINGSEYTTQQTLSSWAFTSGFLKAVYSTPQSTASNNERPTVSINLAENQALGYNCETPLTVNASSDVRRVEYYFDYHYIGESTDKSNDFLFLWNPSNTILSVSSQALITAVAYDDKGLNSIPADNADKNVKFDGNCGPFISATPSVININSVGGEVDVSVISNISSWSVSDNRNWISVSSSSGSHSGSFTVTIDEHTSMTSDRTGTITISGGGKSAIINVTQEKVLPPYISVDPGSLSYNYTGGTKSVSVDANVTWSIVTSDPWLSASPTSGSGEGSISVTVSSNSVESPRTGTITISGEGQTAGVVVTQDAFVPGYKYFNFIATRATDPTSPKIAINSIIFYESDGTSHNAAGYNMVVVPDSVFIDYNTSSAIAVKTIEINVVNDFKGPGEFYLYGSNDQTNWDLITHMDNLVISDYSGNKGVFTIGNTTSFDLNIGINGQGSTLPSSGSYSYTEGTQIEVTAIPDPGYTFDGWSGDETGITNPLSITMDSHKSVTANFSAETYNLTINSTNGTVSVNPDKTSYSRGETVELTAVPNTGYGFINWSGDATGTSNPVTITMNGDKSVTANFSTETYNLTISSTNGTVSANPDKTSYSLGETVELTAVPNEGYGFANWSGDATGTSNPVTITMNGDKSVTANYDMNTYSLGVAASNAAVSKTPDKSNYTHGETVIVGITPDAGYQFDGWGGDASGTSNPLSITMDGNKSLVANISAIPTYSLTINAVNGNVSKSPNQTTFLEGETVVLSAVPGAGYEFSGWSGDASGTANPVTITMDAHKTITASFSMTSNYVLNVFSDHGSVTKTPDKSSYLPGESVEVCAIPDAGYEFDSWTGDVASANACVTVTMDENKNITANYTAITYSLDISAPNATVSKNPDKTAYSPGEVVVLTATANAGYEFDSWGGDLSGSQNPTTITMNGNKSVTLNTKQLISHTLTLASAQNGTITSSPSSSTFLDGETVTIEAIPDAGYNFIGWAGNLSGNTNPAVLIMDGDKTIGATFGPDVSYSLNITSLNGDVAMNPDKTSYSGGEVVQVTAIPDVGYEFVNWAGDLSGTAITTSITMNSNKSISAIFQEEVVYYTLTVSGLNGTVDVIPDQANYEAGATVVLTPVPDAGHEFNGWTGDITGTESPLTIVMDADKVIVAGFEEKVTGVARNELPSLLIYPNPAVGNLNINAARDMKSIKVVNILGQVELARDVMTNPATIDVSGLGQGVYSLIVKYDNGENEIVKFIRH